MPIEDYISLPVRKFCDLTGIGDTMCRQMIADGRIRAVRVGKKKLLIDVASWREYMHRQAVEGVPECHYTAQAVEVRMAKRAQAREERRNVSLEELGL